MLTRSKPKGVEEAKPLLERATGVPIEVVSDDSLHSGRYRPDLVLSGGGKTFVVEIKPSADAAQVAMAARQLHEFAKSTRKKVVLLIMVPYMGDVGRRICDQEGISWFDRSGNAEISASGLRVRVLGQPNRFKRPGRRRSAFAPKSSRISRVLLSKPSRYWSQRDLAGATGISEGYVSQVVRKLLTDGVLVRDDSGQVRPNDPDLMLDAWREAYAFNTHRVTKGHVPARSGEQLLKQVAGMLEDREIDFAVTGLAGAWLLAPFSTFRLVTVFIRDTISHEVLRPLGFREDEVGANLWLVSPNDEAVFYGRTQVQDISCCSAVQVYLDLVAHPERGAEAASHLRSQLLNWHPND